MLDQNTDRMWYVIGAVLVGAAIILIANSLFPSMFKNITSAFEGAISTGTDSFKDIVIGDGAVPTTPTIFLPWL